MRPILNITNGDCAVDSLQNADIPGDFLPWRDVLHEGPVPDGLSLQQLSRIRAAFIGGRKWGSVEAVEASFEHRDSLIADHARYDKILLWFEHDLYDQLQLLQILDWFHTKGREIALVSTNRYLGTLSALQLTELQRQEQPVSGEQLALASTAWTAFRNDTPLAWQALLDRDTSALPFLHGAVIRMLEEYPSRFNGLSRSFNKALQFIAEGNISAARVFARVQQSEERVFMGDSVFWHGLEEMLQTDEPLIRLASGGSLSRAPKMAQILTITNTGREVLAGQRHWNDIAGIDRWIGGVHLVSNNAWYWDGETRQLTNTLQRVPR